MPHCVIEGARSLLQTLGGDELVARVHAAAVDTQLFREGEVKVRLSLYAVSYTHLRAHET